MPPRKASGAARARASARLRIASLEFEGSTTDAVRALEAFGTAALRLGEVLRDNGIDPRTDLDR